MLKLLLLSSRQKVYARYKGTEFPLISFWETQKASKCNFIIEKDLKQEVCRELYLFFTTLLRCSLIPGKRHTDFTLLWSGKEKIFKNYFSTVWNCASVKNSVSKSQEISPTSIPNLIQVMLQSKNCWIRYLASTLSKALRFIFQIIHVTILWAKYIVQYISFIHFILASKP